MKKQNNFLNRVISKEIYLIIFALIPILLGTFLLGSYEINYRIDSDYSLGDGLFIFPYYLLIKPSLIFISNVLSSLPNPTEFFIYKAESSMILWTPLIYLLIGIFWLLVRGKKKINIKYLIITTLATMAIFLLIAFTLFGSQLAE